MEIGDRVEIGALTSLTAESGGRVIVGAGAFISGSCTVAARARVEIGSDAMIAELVSIRDHDHDPDSPPKSGAMLINAVRVGDRVWIGSKCSVTRGASVGDDAVIGTLSVVRGVVPPASLAVGVPSRVVRRLDRPLP